MMSNALLFKQEEYQKTLGAFTSFPPATQKFNTVSEVYDYVRDMQFYINEEITELLESLGDGTRDIHKPWKQRCVELRAKQFSPSDKMQEEAIDLLAFTLNVCIAMGITHDTIEEKFHAVFSKNMRRLMLPYERPA